MVRITGLPSSKQSSSYMDMYTMPGKYVQPNDGGNNFTKCGPQVSDLPIIDNEIFVGRDNDINMVVNMMASARVITL